jgi:tight adherence protein C
MTAWLVGIVWALAAAGVTSSVAAPPRRLPATPHEPAPGSGSGWARWRRIHSRAHGGFVLVALASLVLLPLQPGLAPAPALLLLVLGRLERRRQIRRREAQVVDQLPDLVDLLRITTAAGLPTGAALVAIGGRPGGLLGASVAEAGALLAHGSSTGNALDVLVERCGLPIRSLVDALVDHDRYGTALGPALDRVAIETRLARRRAAEEAARRLPVTLLFPLVLTTLPAFVILAIVPLVMGSFSSLHL